MTKTAEAIHNFVAHCDFDENLSAFVFQMIQKAPVEEQVDLFVRYLLEGKYTCTKRDGKLPVLLEEDTQEEKHTHMFYQFKLNARMNQLKNDGVYSEKEFHEELWRWICTAEEFPTEKNRMEMFHVCAMNDNLPFIDPRKIMSVTREQYEEACEKVDPVKHAMLEHVLQQDFTQLTELASMYLPLLENAETIDEKTILLSWMILNSCHLGLGKRDD